VHPMAGIGAWPTEPKPDHKHPHRIAAGADILRVGAALVA
jgi:hypothetical protein